MHRQHLLALVLAAHLLVLQSAPVHSSTTRGEGEARRNWLHTIVRLGVIALSMVGSASGGSAGGLVAMESGPAHVFSNALAPRERASNDFVTHQLMPHHNHNHHTSLFGDAIVGGGKYNSESYSMITQTASLFPSTELTAAQTTEVESILSNAIVPENVGNEPIPPPSAPTGITVSDITPREIVMAKIGAVFSSAAYMYNKRTESEKHDIENYVRKSLPTLKIEGTTIFDQGETMMFFVRFRDPQTDQQSGALVFRGTNNLANWRDNLRSMFMTTDRTTSEGLFNAYKKLQKNVKSVIRGAVGTKETHRAMRGALRGGGLDEVAPGDVPGLEDQMADLPGGLYVFGHSLGGAMATYAAEDISQYMQRRFPEGTFDSDWLQVMTYGQPREFTDNHESVLHEDSVKYRKIRFVVEGDPVPSLPLMDGIDPGGYVDDGYVPEATEFMIEQPRFTHTGKTVFLHSKASQFSASAIEDDNFAASDAPGFLLRVLNPVKAHGIKHYISAFDNIAHHHTAQRTLTNEQQSLLNVAL